MEKERWKKKRDRDRDVKRERDQERETERCEEKEMEKERKQNERKMHICNFRFFCGPIVFGINNHRNHFSCTIFTYERFFELINDVHL